MKTVILAGGTGTRLWPMSRHNKPKQFQELIGTDSMLVQTIKRLSFQKPEDIFLSTNSEYLDLVKEQTRGLIPEENIIIEPAMRDTAPAIGLIAETLYQKHPDEVMAIIYADHLIQDTQELETKLKIAEQLAQEENTINIIEVKAISPNVNLGYVKIGQQLKTIQDIPIHEFIKFVEKPDLPTAKKFLKAQSYLWNTGLFVWKISNILEKYQRFQRKTYEILQRIANNISEANYQESLMDLYPLCEKISFDYAIMEKVSPAEVRIIPADLGWNDIGTWESIWQELQQEEQDGIVSKGSVIALNSSNSLIYAHGKKPIATIGISDLIVIDTPDALLVCRKEESHQIKELVAKMKDKFPELL